MLNNSEFILNIASLLRGQDVESDIIVKALELFLDSFELSVGGVYEIDQNNCYNLKETTSKGGAILPKGFDKSTIDCSLCSTLLSSKNCLVQSQDLQINSGFLKIFGLTDMILLPLADESLDINGIIILLGNKKLTLSSTKLNTLSLALDMFARYILTRLYQNKVSFIINSLGSILDNTGIDIYVNDFYTHEILYANKSMATPYGGLEKFLGRQCWQVLFPSLTGQCEFCPQKYLIDEYGEPTKIYSWNYQRPLDGKWFRVFSAAFRWVDGRLAHVVSSADISENKHYEELVKYMANYDSLTKLPNRRMLINECERRINKANVNEKGCMLFFDIDGFKKINDEYGHDEGDEFLVKLGEFLMSIPLIKDSVYRNGGDEFVALLDGDAANNGLDEVLATILNRFKQPWQLKKNQAKCNTSIGIALFPNDSNNAEDLLHRADQAMYHIKKLGGGNKFFYHDLDK